MGVARRRFLQTATGAAAWQVCRPPVLPELAAVIGAEPPSSSGAATPLTIPFDAELEPLVRLIEDTPRDRIVAALVERVSAGLPYRRLLAAVFLTVLRRPQSSHSVYLVHSAYQAGLDLPASDAVLPLFWAVDHHKW